MFGMSLPEIAVVLVLGLIVFGPERIPTLAKTLGKALREMRKATAEVRRTLDVDDVRRDLKLRNQARQRARDAAEQRRKDAEARRAEVEAARKNKKEAVEAGSADDDDTDNDIVASEKEPPISLAPTLKPPAGAVVASTGSVTATETSAEGASDSEQDEDAEDAEPADADTEATETDADIEARLKAYLGFAPAPVAAFRTAELPAQRDVTANALTHVALAVRKSSQNGQYLQIVPLAARTTG